MREDDEKSLARIESGDDRPLTLREPLTLQPLRRLEHGGIRGLRAALVATPPTLILALLLYFLGVWPLAAATAVTLVMLTISAVAGAATGRDELPPAAAMRIGADGITAVSEHFERFYPWSEVVDAQRFGTEIVLRLSGGHAFRVPFRDPKRSELAMARIATERKKRDHRLATHQRDAKDAVEPGDESRFITRQRQRVVSGYRQGHESPTTVAEELVDPDFPLQQRLGAAIALSEVETPEAMLALAAARDGTASQALRDAIDTVLDKSATDASLEAAIRAMHPAVRRFLPVGTVVVPLDGAFDTPNDSPTQEADAIQPHDPAPQNTATQHTATQHTALRIVDDAPPQRIDDLDLSQQLALHEAAIEEFEASSAKSAHKEKD